MLDMLFWIFQKYSLSLGYDVNPSILERQGMENQAANRVSLFLYLRALDLSHILDFQQFARVGYRSLCAPVSLFGDWALLTSNFQMSPR